MHKQRQKRFSEGVEKHVRFYLCSLVLFSLGVTACSVVQQTAEGTYQIATAPFRLFQHSSPTPTSTPVPPPKSSPSPRAKRQLKPSPRPSASPGAKSSHAVSSRNTGSASPSLRPVQSTTFPTAKSVPDKPGYVFSPAEPTKYVDVSGYAPGSKVKDPYSGQIFIVP